MRMFFSPGQIAALWEPLGVSRHTVLRLINSGELKGHKLLAKKFRHRRVHRTDLISYMIKEGIPLGDLENEAKGRVLFVGVDPLAQQTLADNIAAVEFEAVFDNDGFAAGMTASSSIVDCIVVDFSMGLELALQLAQNVRKNSECDEIILIGLLSEDQSLPADCSVFKETFEQPVDATILALSVKALVERRDAHS